MHENYGSLGEPADKYSDIDLVLYWPYRRQYSSRLFFNVLFMIDNIDFLKIRIGNEELQSQSILNDNHLSYWF